MDLEDLNAFLASAQERAFIEHASRPYWTRHPPPITFRQRVAKRIRELRRSLGYWILGNTED